MKYDHCLEKETKIIQLIVANRYRYLRHAILLLGTVVTIAFSTAVTDYSGAYSYFRLLCISTALITMSYVNMNVLVPIFFFRGRYIVYLALLILLVLIGKILMSSALDSTFIAAQLGTYMHERNDYKMGSYEGTIILVSVILITTTIKLFQRWMRDKERITELRNLTLSMELSELRNQINPHFLFNMLNGIKALVRGNPEKATTVIMKLSEFLRYQLYENNEEKTLLMSEINFLSNFLDLEKLRRDNLSVDIINSTDPPMLNHIFLPPNLFTTFVENAVKHSVNISGAASYVKINLEVKNNEVHFHCVNSIDPLYIPIDEKHSGLGLANIKRRLDLLYGNKHVLKITPTENEYDVKLTIPI
ncbi:sensor histidine kinase [Olivibacter domesticus]|uniref:Histidine kinase n=1 Tax=Olivibacter domesticus TaxID=407022 RepID=A0A1H7R4P2_OLID1|nr:histidine kinase [Olivibacter domesticus]SEL55153.1 Histidine kinase [Olivibacter domesticus]